MVTRWLLPRRGAYLGCRQGGERGREWIFSWQALPFYWGKYAFLRNLWLFQSVCQRVTPSFRGSWEIGCVGLPGSVVDSGRRRGCKWRLCQPSHPPESRPCGMCNCAARQPASCLFSFSRALLPLSGLLGGHKSSRLRLSLCPLCVFFPHEPHFGH